MRIDYLLACRMKCLWAALSFMPSAPRPRSSSEAGGVYQEASAVLSSAASPSTLLSSRLKSICGRPLFARKLNPADRIACFHMSGLLMLSYMTAGQDGFRGASSNQSERSRYAAGLPGMSRVLDRSIAPSSPYLASCEPKVGRPSPGRSLGSAPGARTIIALPAGHQLPGDAGDLVGERHRDQLRRLAVQQVLQPRPGPPAAAADLTDQRCRTDYQHATQRFVTGARDRPEAGLATSGMVLWRKTDPGGKV